MRYYLPICGHKPHQRHQFPLFQGFALLPSSCDTTPKETPNIEVVSTQNNDKKPAQTVKSGTKIACEKIEEDDSLRKIEEQQEQLQMMRKGDYVIRIEDAVTGEIIDTNSLEEMEFQKKIQKHRQRNNSK